MTRSIRASSHEGDAQRGETKKMEVDLIVDSSDHVEVAMQQLVSLGRVVADVVSKKKVDLDEEGRSAARGVC